jgi:hypothetical protein
MQTYGWDTVFVINTSRVNAALAAHKNELLMEFDGSLGADEAISAAGKFQAWEVVQGGSGQILYLNLPILEGVLKVGEGLVTSAMEEVIAHEVSLAGISVVMSIQLKILPRSGSPEGSDYQDLKFDIEQVGTGNPGPGLITPVTVVDPEGRLSQTDRAFLLAVLAEFLVANSAKVAFVFASVNLVPPSSNSWLAPAKTDYAYLDKIGYGSYLAVLSVTEERDISQLPRMIDSGAIAQGKASSFLISGGMFLKHVIQPYLPAAYHTVPGSFVFDQASQSIRNTGSFQAQSLKVGAITYYPRIDELTLTTNAEGLSTYIRGYCDLYAGISMTFTIRTKNKAVFNLADKTISFLPDPSPDSSHDANIPWYYWFLGFIAALITELVVKLISDGIASALDDLARQALSIAKTPPQSIQWTDTTALDVNSAGVNDSFYMMGQI